MTTIEEKAKTYAEKHWVDYVQSTLTIPWDEVRESIKSIYLAGAAEALSLPLADRLTHKERERITDLYLSPEEIEGAASAFSKDVVAVAEITRNILINIFGVSMFEEKGGEV